MNNTEDKLQNALAQHEQRVLAAFKGHASNLYLELEAFTSIISVIKPIFPLPPMRGWAISPDFGVLLISEILKNKPNIIVELGCGVSTLITAYCLKRLGQGMLISVENDQGYLDASVDNIRCHGLDEYVEQVYAPLVDVKLPAGIWQWYDTSQLTLTESVDMLVVDGPRADTQTNARYPAIAQFYEDLSDDTVVILDDAARQDEQNIVKQWLREYPEFKSEFHDCEKGAVILRR